MGDDRNWVPVRQELHDRLRHPLWLLDTQIVAAIGYHDVSRPGEPGEHLSGSMLGEDLAVPASNDEGGTPHRVHCFPQLPGFDSFHGEVS